jgi:hypothetical protein
METEDIKMALNILEESIDNSFSGGHKIDMNSIKKLSKKIQIHNKKEESVTEVVNDSITVSHVNPNSDMFKISKKK